MSFEYRRSDMNMHRLSLSGPLNIARSAAVIQLFQETAQQGVEGVVVDLADVPFIDSQGLAALIAGYEIFGSNERNFRLVGIQAQPRLVLELTGFDQVFQSLAYPEDDELEGSPYIQILPAPAFASHPTRLAATVSDWST